MAQNQAYHRVTASLSGIDLAVTKLELTEAFDQLYVIELDVAERRLSTSKTLIDLEGSLIDREVNITLHNEEGVQRHLHGVIHQVEHGAVGHRWRQTKLYISPVLQRLTLSHHCAIYQHLNAQEIIQQILQQQGIVHVQWRSNKTRMKREFTVMYNESYFDFIRRLAAEEGLLFFFEHHNGYHDLVFIDSINQTAGLSGPRTIRNNSAKRTEDGWYGFRFNEQRVVTRTLLRDYWYRTPQTTLESRSMGLNVGDQQAIAHYEYQGRFKNKKEQGDAFTETRQQSFQRSQQVAVLTGDYLDTAVARHVQLDGLADEEHNEQPWVIIHSKLTMNQPQAMQEDAGDQGSHTELTTQCIPWTQPFMPAALAKPVIPGAQHAVVVGPPGEELFTDEEGRVRVRFFWDRARPTSPDLHSCWLRVKRNWAGHRYGQMIIPRVGMEVEVSFFEGDPDQPYVTGVLYNADHLPPYKLPVNKTRSVIMRSKTLLGEGYNELSVEDKKDNEEIYMHAQKDYNQRVLNDKAEHIGQDRHQKIERDRVAEIHQQDHLTVGHSRQVHVKQDQSHSVDGNSHHKTGSLHTLDVGSELHIKAGQKIVVEAGAEITLKVGGNFVKIDASGVYGVGTHIALNDGGSAGSGAGFGGSLPQMPREVDYPDSPPAFKAATREEPVYAPINYPAAAQSGAIAVEGCIFDEKQKCLLHNH